MICMAAYTGHFAKRIVEAWILHKYSKPWALFPAVHIGLFYATGAAICHWWVNFRTTEAEAEVFGQTLGFRAIGPVLFLAGESINLYHHYLLAALRKKGQKKRYVVPHGGLFAVSTCPHYLGELIAWFGISVMMRHVIPYLCWLTMFFYLGARAFHTKEWYLKKKMKGFPVDRECLVPFLF